MTEWETLAQPVILQEKIRESDFIAQATRADKPEEALAYVRALQPLYPGVSHICWAYRIGGQHRCSDDGEPGGTAGAPILRAIEGQKLDYVVVAVARYFGGVKLGAGGLMRAYGGTAAQLLRNAPRQRMVFKKRILVEVPFELTRDLYHWLERLDASDRQECYTDTGIKVAVFLPETEISLLASGLGHKAMITEDHS